MKTAVRCGWPALLPTYPSSEALTATGCPSGEWLTGKDSSGTGRRQPSLTGADMYTFAVAGISRTPALSMSGDMACPAAAAIANLSIMNTAPAVGRRSWPSLELLRNTPEFSRELPASAGELNNPVSQSWRGLALQLTRRPGQRGQHHAPTGSVLGRLDQKFPQRDIDVDIVEFEVEGGLHVGGADDARCRVVLPSHPPQFLAFGERHLYPAVAAGNGAFDRDFSGHFPILQRQIEEGVSGMRTGRRIGEASRPRGWSTPNLLNLHRNGARRWSWPWLGLEIRATGPARLIVVDQYDYRRLVKARPVGSSQASLELSGQRPDQLVGQGSAGGTSVQLYAQGYWKSLC